MKKVRAHLTFANVMSVVAVFVALGGGAYALTIPRDAVKSKHIRDGHVRNRDLGPGAVDSGKVRDGSIVGGDVDESTLGSVPQAQNATTAGNADTLDGLDGGAFARAASEPWRVVGTPGQPAFMNNWQNAPGAGVTRFYRDPLGIVHLSGVVTQPSGSTNTMFELPAGYRPAQALEFAVATCCSAAAGRIVIFTDGAVSYQGGDRGQMALDGIDFRAEQ